MTDRATSAKGRHAILHQIRMATGEAERLQLEKKLQALDRGHVGLQQNGKGESLVIRSSDLGKLIDHWLLQQEDEGALGWLSDRSGLDPRAIYKIRMDEQKFTSLSDTDKLLVAMGMQEWLSSGELSPIPNPNWSYEKWIGFMEERGCA